MNADGANVERLTQDLAPKGLPSWSPDGQKIAFSGKIDGNMEIFVVSPDGERLKKLTENGARDYYPSWSPDGQLIAFVSDRNAGFRSQIHVMTADGEYLKQLSDLHLANDVDPDWLNSGLLPVSPDAPQATTWGGLKNLAPDLR